MAILTLHAGVMVEKAVELPCEGKERWRREGRQRGVQVSRERRHTDEGKQDVRETDKKDKRGENQITSDANIVTDKKRNEK